MDRAALDLALEYGIPHGGWVPKGRLAEDGRLADIYTGLHEAPDSQPDTRTLMNVRDADATLILAQGRLHGGTLFTQQCAQQLERPLLILHPRFNQSSETLMAMQDWLGAHKVRVLNIAGPRVSEDPQIYALTQHLLRQWFSGMGSAGLKRSPSNWPPPAVPGQAPT